MKNKLILIIFAGIITTTAFAQIDGLGNILGSGTENAGIYFENYFAPFTNAFGASLNAGWYNSAKPHKLGGFDITANFNFAFVPDADKTFDLSTLQLQNVSFPEGPMTATISGSRDGGKAIVYTPAPTIAPNQNVTIDAPGGSGLGFTFVPMPQIGIGLVKQTELNVRFLPKVSVKKYGDISLWGVGIKHDLLQWIPVLSKAPVFQLSVQGGYTKLSSKFNLNVTPSVYQLQGSGDYSNQQLGLDVKSFTANLLIGANLPVVSFYGGLGFATTNSVLDLTGNFPVPTVNTSGELTITDVVDPVHAEMTNSDGSTTKPRINGGMRIKLGVITIHGDYTYANYSTATAGIGISFR